MRFRLIYLSPIFILLLSSCTQEQGSADQPKNVWVQPEAGTSVNLGDELPLQVELEDKSGVDSVIYFADSVRLKGTTDAGATNVTTKGLSLGNRLITAKVFRKGQAEEFNTNIVLKSNLVPIKYSYQVKQVFDHDTSSYTQGLEYENGFFYESDGGNTPETGYSSLRKVEVTTGKVVQKLDFPSTFFAEGLTVVDDKIILLTWQQNTGFVFDKKSFKQLSEFPYQNSRQGWGLTSDEKRLYKSDGTNFIYFLNRDTYLEEGYIEVFDQNGPVSELNELEMVEGKIYANVYNTDRIVIIDPATGQVTGEVDLSDLLPAIYQYPDTDVLNGIAWDAKGKRLFVTGKRWAKLFEVQLRVTN